MKKNPSTKSYALRIDGPLVKPLQELKKRNRRSLNAEINAALDAWIALSREQSANVDAVEVVSSQPVDGAEAAPAAKPRRSKKQVKQEQVENQAQADVTPEPEATPAPETAVS